MKLLSSVIALSLLGTAYSVSAESLDTQAPQQTGKWKEGFSGSFMLLFGVTSSNSNEDGGDDHIDDLNSKGDRESEAYVLPIAGSDISYTFSGGDKQVFLGTDNANIALGKPHLEMGYGQHFNNVGTFKISYMPGVISTKSWEDPYTTDGDRDETDVTMRGFRLQYTDILGTGFGAEVSTGRTFIDDEHSGETFGSSVEDDMDREGHVYYGEFYYVYQLDSRTILRPAVSYLRNDANGEAVSSDSYAAQFGILHNFDNSMITLNLKYRRADYDEENPIFKDKREDDVFDAVISYTYNDIFGWKGVSAGVLGGYTDNNSNIEFYEHEGWVLGTGIGYSF